MKRVKQVVASFLLTFFYSFALVSAFATVRIAPDTLEVEAGEPIVFEAHVSDDQTQPDVTFQRFIDGQELVGMETTSLALSWNEYVAYFPEDESNEVERAVSFVISTAGERIGADEAVLHVKKPLSAERVPLGIVRSSVHS